MDPTPHPKLTDTALFALFVVIKYSSILRSKSKDDEADSLIKISWMKAGRKPVW